MTKRWKYSGDMDLEYGGLFWRAGLHDDYVDAVRVTPCSDAGGPDNLFYIETGSIYMPRDKAAVALDTCGYRIGYVDPKHIRVMDCTGAIMSKANSRALLVDAFAAYHGIERDYETVVQIGPAEERNCNGWSPDPDHVLRSNAKLANFVRRECLGS